MDASEANNLLLEELDEARLRLFAKCDHDSEKVFDYFMEYQKQFADRLLSRHQRPLQDKSAT